MLFGVVEQGGESATQWDSLSRCASSVVTWPVRGAKVLKRRVCWLGKPRAEARWGLSHLCFSQMMQFCWFHQDMTSSLYWDGHSGLGDSGCPKWRYLHKKRAALVH